MAEFDPVGWLHEQGFQLDIHTAKMVNALAAEARRRAMEEAAVIARDFPAPVNGRMCLDIAAAIDAARRAPADGTAKRTDGDQQP